MNSKVEKQLKVLKDGEYKALRNCDLSLKITEYAGETELRKNADRFIMNIDNEKPIFYGDDIFGFNIYNRNFLKIDPRQIGFGNITIDYQTVLAIGLNGIKKNIEERYSLADANQKTFYDCVLECFEACERAVQRYKQSAQKAGKIELSKALEVVPMNGAKNYYQALITVKFMQYSLRLNSNDHLSLGRFDKYMKPYFDYSINNNMTKEQALELTELFFIAMNFDTDIYTGLQKGDNGQSLVLGGYTENGEEFNELSAICLDASEELNLIDPKINLRVNKDTPLWLFERATRLTKKGLGFPQYLNDDIIIDGLVKLGYDEKDAKDFTVAACWENIIPRCSADIPNVATLDFAKVVDEATKEDLVKCKTFEEFLCFVDNRIKDESDRLMQWANGYFKIREDAYISAFILPCIEKGKPISQGGAKYYNFGCHGAGIATATNALYAIQKAVFEDKTITAEKLIQVLESNFEGAKEIKEQLISYPKMGQDEDEVDQIAGRIMQTYSSYLNGKPTPFGGIYRAGTGSAQEYVFSAKNVPATADGREKGDVYGSSFSPSPQSKTEGLLSVIKSFTKFDMRKIINGGPVTIEIHDTVFRNEDGLKKVAMLVKLFITRGGHQIQINSVNAQVLKDAQKSPENYKNLIVRVWGWSGYFNELDVNFQNQIIRRAEFKV